MIPIRKHILLIIAVLFFSYGWAQDHQAIDVLEICNQWKSKLSELERSMVKMPDHYTSFKELSKAKVKIEKDISKILEEMQNDPEDIGLFDELIMQNTNVSIWYSEITTDDFQVFLRRLVTGRPINKDVIQDLKGSYLKWIRNPTIKNLNRYSQMLLEMGRSYEILTKLKITADDTVNALIKYRSVTNTNIETLRGPVAEKTIPVGNYYIWLEKDGKVLSDNTNGFPCIRSTKAVFLDVN